MKTFRDNGAPGALLDEYERAIDELKQVILPIDKQSLVYIVDHKTEDKDCKSIQTILNHVLSAGYSYVIQMRNFLGESLDFPKISDLNSAQSYIAELSKLMQFNEAFFNDYPNLDLDNYDGNRFKVSWGALYDIEQLFEHAIVHILRHRRQIERFILKMNG